MMPSCDQPGVPIHFHSSTTSGSASLMSLRILLRVSPRQSPSSAILFEMSSDADWPWLAPDFFMFALHSEAVVDVRLEPARHAGVNLRQAVDRGVVEAHRAVVLVGEILERNSNLDLPARGRVVRAHLGDTKCRLFNRSEERRGGREVRSSGRG